MRTVRQGQLRELERQFSRHQGLRPRSLPHTDILYRAVEKTPRVDLPAPTQHRGRLDRVRVHSPLPRSTCDPCGGIGSGDACRCLPLRDGSDSGRVERPRVAGTTYDGPARGIRAASVCRLSRVPTAGFSESAVSVPKAVGDVAQRVLYRAIGKWENTAGQPLKLTLGSQGIVEMSRLRGPVTLASLRPAVWRRPSRRWASATPLALPKHPGRLSGGSAAARARAWRVAEATVAAACVHVGLPEPSAVEVSLAAFLVGGRAARQFPPFSQNGRDGRPVRRQLVHASLTFEEPVAGPLMLGSGRFLGLGLMRPTAVPELEGSGEPRVQLTELRRVRHCFEPASGNMAMVDELTSDDFSAFFRDVHGHPPFPWQCRLTAQVLDREVWPRVIDLPTGTGKTAVLDTAVFAMAARRATSPRRIVFVIDRRIVVDQVCQRAQRIRDRVAAGETPILHRVRERLHALSDARNAPRSRRLARWGSRGPRVDPSPRINRGSWCRPWISSARGCCSAATAYHRVCGQCTPGSPGMIAS